MIKRFLTYNLKKSLLIFLFFLSLSSLAQVGVNTNTPDPSAKLEIAAIDKGFLVPRISLTNVTDTSVSAEIPSPATGLLIWNTNTSVMGGYGVGFYFFNGSIWQKQQVISNLDIAYDTGGAGVGKDITADSGVVTIQGEDGLVIVGTYAAGISIDSETSGQGTKLFFNPSTASFRTGIVDGTQWDDTNLGNYSFGVGENTTPKSGISFAANFNTGVNTHGVNAAAFGNASEARANASFSIGNATISSNNNALSIGDSNKSRANHSLSIGEHVITNSISETAIGSYSQSYTRYDSSDSVDDSYEKFYKEDRTFVIGNGTSSATSNAFEIWKDGRIIINESYTLPTADGTANQILQTDGVGNLTWQDESEVSDSNTLVTLFTKKSTYVMNNIGPNNTDLTGIEAAIIPSIFEASGEVQVKVFIRYTEITGTANLRLRVHNGTSGSTIIATGAGWTNTSTATGGVIESPWKNWSAGLVPYEVHLSGSVDNSGDELIIKNVYLLIKK